MLNSESIVIIRNKGEHLLYSKISGGMIDYGWGNVCYIVNFPLGKYLLYSKVSGGKVYYIVNIPGEGLLCGRFTIRHRNNINYFPKQPNTIRNSFISFGSNGHIVSSERRQKKANETSV